ncbi:MAG: hypothetical protein H7Z12_19865 [Rhodospirillaceae bacterium]|nr:hypothetical protein [Rhodospirillales bacterium]
MWKSFGLALAALPLLAGCDEKIERVEDLSRRIVKVEKTNVLGKGERLEITYFEKDILSEKAFVSGLAFDAIKINKGIVANWPDKYFEVLYFFKAPTTDKFGQSGDALALKVKWDVADLKKVNWDNFTAWGMLSIASDVQFKPLGRQAVTAYCSDEDNLRYAIDFCRRLIL